MHYFQKVSFGGDKKKRRTAVVPIESKRMKASEGGIERMNHVSVTMEKGT